MKDLFNHQNSMVFGVKKIQRRHCRAFLKDQIPNHILVMRKDEEKLLKESVSDSDSWTGRVQGRQGGSRDRQDGDLWPASYVPLLPRCSRG